MPTQVTAFNLNLQKGVARLQISMTKTITLLMMRVMSSRLTTPKMLLTIRRTFSLLHQLPQVLHITTHSPRRKTGKSSKPKVKTVFDSTQIVKQGRIIGRVVDMWDDVGRIIAQGMIDDGLTRRSSRTAMYVFNLLSS
jgi:hypothetical protein